MSHKPDIQLGCLVKEGIQSNIMGQGLWLLNCGNF